MNDFTADDLTPRDRGRLFSFQYLDERDKPVWFKKLTLLHFAARDDGFIEYKWDAGDGYPWSFRTYGDFPLLRED